MMKFASIAVVALAGFAFLTAVADEPDKPNPKRTVSGLITFDGQPLSEGRILIHTTDKQIVGCLVNDDGKYLIKNPPRGSFRVTVHGSNVGDRYSQIDNGLKLKIGSGSDVTNFELWHGDQSSSSRRTVEHASPNVPNSPEPAGLVPAQPVQSVDETP